MNGDCKTCLCSSILLKEYSLSKLKAGIRQYQKVVRDESAELVKKRVQHLKPCILPPGYRAICCSTQKEFYKVVAAVSNPARLVSVFDGHTEYNLGKTLLAKRGSSGWAPLDCCFFVYEDPQAALCAPFPKRSKSRQESRVLLKVRCSGRGYQKGDKFAFTSITPILILTDAVNIKPVNP